MLIHPQINPVALQLGPLAVHWYGLTYLAAFGLFMLLGWRRLRHEPYASLTGACLLYTSRCVYETGSNCPRPVRTS